jgi:hypothetical protein
MGYDMHILGLGLVIMFACVIYLVRPIDKVDIAIIAIGFVLLGYVVASGGEYVTNRPDKGPPIACYVRPS